DWENIFGVDYDVNENLAVAFTLTDNNDEEVAEGDVTLDDEGDFEVPLEDLTDGEYTLTLSVEDIAQNTAEESVIINVTGEEPEVPEEIGNTLTPSTTEPTEGPVTVTVEADSESDLVAAKWLEGDLSEEDFAEAGNDIDLEDMTFDIEENGTYTVYVKNDNDVEAVETITVDNITEEEEETFTIDLTKEPTEQTDGPVTINIDTDSESELVELKWLDGDRSAEDFAEEGTDIDLDDMSFEVTENGMYTVYAKNS